MADGTDVFHLPGFYEPFSAISHLFAAVLFLALGWILIRRGRGNRTRTAFIAVYSVSSVFLLSMSAVYHMTVRGGFASVVMERLDHGAIFVFIAGTFTAVHGVMFRGWFRWIPLVAVWCIAAAFITLKTVFFESLPEWVGLTFYIGFGWGVGLTAIPVFKRHGIAYLVPFIGGGIAYSVGALVEPMTWIVVVPGVVHSHDVWHLAVLAGALMHWWFIWNVLGNEIAPEPTDTARDDA